MAIAKHWPLCTRAAHVRFSSTSTVRPWQLVRDMRRSLYVEREAAFPDKAVAPHVLQDFVRRAKDIDFKDPEAFMPQQAYFYIFFTCLKLFFHYFSMFFFSHSLWSKRGLMHLMPRGKSGCVLLALQVLPRHRRKWIWGAGEFAAAVYTRRQERSFATRWSYETFIDTYWSMRPGRLQTSKYPAQLSHTCAVLICDLPVLNAQRTYFCLCFKY